MCAATVPVRGVYSSPESRLSIGWGGRKPCRFEGEAKGLSTSCGAQNVTERNCRGERNGLKSMEGPWDCCLKSSAFGNGAGGASVPTDRHHGSSARNILGVAWGVEPVAATLKLSLLLSDPTT